MKYSLVVDSLSVSYRSWKGDGKKGLASLAMRPKRVVALQGVSFSCFKGETIGVVGANGAGKSTLLQSLASQLRYSGEVRAHSIPRLVKLNQALPFSFTGRQQCDLIINSFVDDEALSRRYVQEALEFSELGEFVDAPVRAYSKGMKARLTFSALTQGNPDIVLVDEALAVGDRRFVRKAARRIRDLTAGSTTVLICDHSTPRLRAICDRGLLFERGKLVFDSSINNVLDLYDQRSG